MLFCHILTVFIVCTHTRKWLYYSCFTDVFLQLRLFWSYLMLFCHVLTIFIVCTNQIWWSYLMLFCHVLTIFIVCTNQIWWSYLMLFCHVLTFFIVSNLTGKWLYYCCLTDVYLINNLVHNSSLFYNVHLYWKMFVLFLYYSSLSYIAPQNWW